MSRLIDADELKSTIINGHEVWHYTGICAVIDYAPTVNAVEVVRCEKCKFLRIDEAETLFCDHIYSPSYNRAVWYDDFCRRGERITDEQS